LILEEYFAVACLSLICLVMIVDGCRGHWISDLDRSQKEAVVREVSLEVGRR
jgi:hypothetical protein